MTENSLSSGASSIASAAIITGPRMHETIRMGEVVVMNDALNWRHGLVASLCQAAILLCGNWAGPIGSFKLSIDKGAPERLISFCFKDINKVSPTRFEADVKDFAPSQNLRILIIGKGW